MKRIISIIISIILFTATIVFILINTISLYFNEANIINIVKNTNFEQLVNFNVKDKENYLYITINDMYKEQKRLNFTSNDIRKVLNHKQLKNNISNIATNEVQYIFKGKYKNINIDFSDSKDKYKSYLKENTYKFNNLKKEVHKSTSKIIKNKENLIIILNSNIVKIILLSSIIISIIILLIINRKNAFNYISTTLFLVSILLTLISIFTPIILNKLFKDYTLYILLTESIRNSFNTFFIISVALIVITVFLILIGDIKENKKGKSIRPRIISKYSDNFFC